MNRLRGLMAEGSDGQDRLSRIVQLVAGTMVADVCSIYLRTPERTLRLAATEGLDPGAVNKTEMAFDEGLVGQIATRAAPLAIDDAPRHPSFSYRPETGEDPYHAFLGVPILRGGLVLGVLTVQNQSERHYDEQEIETLQTIAMVIAEVVVALNEEAMRSPDEREQREAARMRRPRDMEGRSLCPGLAMGTVLLHDPVVPAAKFFAEDTEQEVLRLEQALEDLQRSIDHMIARETFQLGGDSRDIMETFRLLAMDKSWSNRLKDGIRSGLSAEASVDKARAEHRARLQKARDPYLRERFYDLEDLDNRLLRVLSGVEGPQQNAQGAILIARRLGPADLLEYATAGLGGIVLEEAATASHAAIVARAIGIPTLGGVDRVISFVENGMRAIVDADDGTLHLRPDAALIEAFKTRAAMLDTRQALYRDLRDQPAITEDGVEVNLLLNLGLDLDLHHIAETGAKGVGLFRTEFQFLVSDQVPTMSQQRALYKRAMDAADGKRVTFRTIDFGADKILGLQRNREDNPALGWRSIRLALDRKGLFRRQLRALIRAAEGRPLSVMFPMVTTVEEFRSAKELLLDEVEWSVGRGYPRPAELSVGAMLEVPALAYDLERLSVHADFISIGTNDLLQFFHAADRMLPNVSDRYDFMRRPVLKFMKMIFDDCARLGMNVSVCGEAAGHPLDAMVLIALGCRDLSVTASNIGPLKNMVRSLPLQKIAADLDDLLQHGNSPLRKEVLGLSSKYDVQIVQD